MARWSRLPRNSSGLGARGSGLGKNEAKSENSILRLLADSWWAEARISRGSTDLSFARRLLAAHCVCLWDRDIDAASCESSDFRDSPGVEGEVDRYADVGFHLGGRGWALLPSNY